MRRKFHQVEALLNKSELDDRLPLPHLLCDPDAVRHIKQRHPVQRLSHCHRLTHLRFIVPKAQMTTQQGFGMEHSRFCQ